MKSQNQEIVDYFHQLDRSLFMHTNKEAAEMDTPAPIGYGQTISQPSLVLKMTLSLDLQPKANVLEIGTGSGFQTALLAAFSHTVYTVERIEALYSQAKENVAKTGLSNISFHLSDGSLGWKEHAPYDRIMVTAAVSEIPDELIDQLAAGGKMLIPVGSQYMQELQLIEKDKEGEITSTFVEDVAFVRLVGKYD